MQMPLIFILLTFGPIQQGASQEAPSAADIAKLVEQLGGNKFAARQSATKRLKAIGRPAVSALRQAQSEGKPEVKARAKSILGYILGTATRSAFLADPTIQNARTVSCWNRLRTLVDSDDAAVTILKDWLTREPRLFETQVLGGRDLTVELKRRTAGLTNFAREQVAEKDALASIAAIAFVVSDPTTELPRDARSAAESIFEMGVTRKALSPKMGNNQLLRKLAGAWVSRSGSQYQKLIMSLKYSLPEALPLAESIVRSKARGKRMEYALHLIGKLGGEDQVPLLESMLANDVILSKRMVRAVDKKKTGERVLVAYDYRVRDLALAMLWHLHGEHPARHGFDPKRMRPHQWYLFALESMGFTSDEQRAAAFAEWDQFDRTAGSKPVK